MVSFLRSCARFSGRASRVEYWRVMRRVFLIPAIIVIIVAVFYLSLGAYAGGNFIGVFVAVPVGMVFALVLSPLCIAVTVRRLHDTGRSARWLFGIAVIILGWLAVAAAASLSYMSLPKDGSDDGFGAVGWTFLVFFTGGFWSLVSLAVIGALIAICNRPGVVGPNRYGPDPLTPGPEVYTPPNFGALSPVTGAEAGMSPHEHAEGRPCTQCNTRLHPEARFCFNCCTAV